MIYIHIIWWWEVPQVVGHAWIETYWDCNPGSGNELVVSGPALN